MTARLLRPEPGPDTLKVTRWGGRRLATLRGGPEHVGASVGESWELSTLPGRVSRVDGRPLDARLGGPLPFLAKLIDTALPLSVQVHPDDRPAGPGKEEAWMILDAEPDAALWAGLAPGVSVDHFVAAAAAARADRSHERALFDRLRAIPARPGTILLVPAGTVHAIGGGVLLAEIQQPTDCTFRIYDYHSGRDLHIDDAARTLRTDAQPVIWTTDDAPRTLTGKHLTLEILTAGAHRLDSAAPRLVAVVRGAATIAGAALETGALALLLPGTDLLEVGDAGVVVVGRCA
ncbi:MAG: class I mannose-6-phosphate isomerase [Nannocystaceae bacterium]